GSDIIDMEVGDVFFDPGYVATNSTGDDVSNSVRVSGDVNANQAGVYTVNYEFDNGNSVVAAERKVVVNTASCPDTCTTGCIKLAAHHMQCAADFPGAQNITSNPVSIDASQTTCTAPCGVHFTADAKGDYGVESNFHHLAYHWDFGDSKSFFRALDEDFAFGAEANRAQGMYAAHVFAEPGEYEVTLYTAAKNGRYSNSKVTITVQAPEDNYAAAETLCVSSSKDFEGCPTGAAHYDNWDAMTSAVRRLNRAYVVLRAGDTFDMNTNMILRTGDYVFDRFGEGDDPIVNVLNSKTTIITQTVKSISVAHWQLIGDYDPKTGIGNSFGAKGLYFGQGDDYHTNNVTVYRNSISGLGMCFAPRGGVGHVFADNTCTNWQDYGSLSDYTSRLAFIGNSVRQNPEAISGGDQKKDSKTEHAANGSQRTFSYSFNVLAENDMAVQTEDANGKITEFTLGQGYSLNMDNKTITLASAPKS
ncbi:immunoglobulin-like domain-containing protein, partial [Marinibactrum halimedae]|uniref:immunoglobulin-like domain-containing protein n=1 Tax=Marinibactrum halimedae TaxID=1444977 RepID=UPI0024E09456